jgi:hypothetical protein
MLRMSTRGDAGYAIGYGLKVGYWPCLRAPYIEIAFHRWRDLIRARTGEGRERAKARSVKMGRKPKLTPHQQAEAIKRREAGEPMRDIGKSFNVSHSTISRLTA